MSLKNTVACVKNNQHFLITAHLNLEGDALGSELAFSWMLKALGKRATIVNEADYPSEYDFLPGIKNIKKFNKIPKGIKFDCFVVLDCSDLKRCGEVYKLNTGGKPVLNIDHHISNERFGEVNWVEPQASSTCQMLYKLYKKLHIPLDRNAAMSLYVGMLTDTGSFRYSNTSALTHNAVSQLMKYNLDTAQIYKKIYENIPFQDIRLLSKILPTIRRQGNGRVAWFQIKRDVLKHKKISFDLTEHLLSFARAIKGVEAAVLFKENLGVKNEIRVNLRSQGKIDVNRIAQIFGGGGHKTAAGATVKGKIEAVRSKVLAKIRESFK